MNTLVRSTGNAKAHIDAIHTVTSRLAARTIAMLKTWADRRRTRDQLNELDDAMLRDLGISRGNANFEASKAFWQP